MMIRHRVALGAALTTAALLGLGTTAASAAPVATDDSSTVEECNFGEHLVRVWLGLPPELRSDLKDLKDLEPGERGPAAREIREGAREGEYGPGVQGHARRMHDRQIHIWAALPVELKNDLRELKDLEPEERRDAAEAIAQDALDGAYGEKVQNITEHIQDSEFWQSCVAD